METYYKNKEGNRYLKKVLENGKVWWSRERGDGEFYVISGEPSEEVSLIKRDCYVFDLDQTLFDNSEREHLAPADPSLTENWTEWNRACHLDSVIEPIANIARSLSKDYEVCYITSRCEDGLTESYNAIMETGLPLGHLLMRAIGDVRSQCDIKAELFMKLSETHNILAAFEDQQDIVDKLTVLGYKMIKV